MYNDLVQTGDYPPAEGKKNSIKEDNFIQGLLNKIDSELNKLELDVGTKLKENKISGNSSANDSNKKNDSKQNWRHTAPKERKLHTKTVDEKLYKWCQTCRKGKGHWTTGDSLHSTDKHNPSK